MEMMVVSLKMSTPKLHFFLTGWYVEWITIQMNNGLEFSCDVNGFLDNGANPVGPGKREVACYPSGAKKLS